MKTAKSTGKLALALLAGALMTGCVGESTDEPSEDLGSAEDEMLGGVMITPFNVGFAACTPSINFRLTPLRSQLGFLAVDVTPTIPLTLGLFTANSLGVLTPIAGVSPLAIDAALLASVRADLALAMAGLDNVFFGSPLLFSDAQISLLAARLGATTRANLLSLVGHTATTQIATQTLGVSSLALGAGIHADLAMLHASLRLALSPIGPSTLIFPNLLTLGTPDLILGATFASVPASLTRLNVLAATSVGRLRALDLAMPFLPGCPAGGLLGLGPIVPPILPGLGL